MSGSPPVLPDWREEAAYLPLFEAEPASLAWEWLRRDPVYRDAARARSCTALEGPVSIVRVDPAAEPWGLHAFEDPDLPAAAARPVWRRHLYPRTLVATAEPAGAAEDRFDLARFAPLATVVRDDRHAEHLLLCDGLASLRLDVTHGSLLAEPVRLAYLLTGFAALDGPLVTLQALMKLHETGRLPKPEVRSRNRRLVLLLRAYDALLAGASQREIAGCLLSAEAMQARWRTEVPSLRLRAQRLVGGAQAMARGGYRELLRS